ncbi:MAG: arsenite methyltransferase [Clostridioides sp.]|jgi:SAM-dependent methyltransferase|nr:arsenite methyltransferase [Clostridioides sp.]
MQNLKKMQKLKKDIVTKGYGKIARKQESLEVESKIISKSIGYSEAEMSSVPQNANLGLGCGNPQLVANIKEGEVVLDLGSGAGFDCFIAAAKVGEKGRVIGIDMTKEMVVEARKNLEESNFNNVKFINGDIENLPIKDNSVDVIISNCVINLSPNKQKVYEEAYRVLKNGGRIAISDIVLKKELTDEMKSDERLYCG